MNVAFVIQFVLLIAALVVATRYVGAYLAGVFGAKEVGADHSPGDRIFLPVENAVYKISGVDPKREQRWNTYALSVLAFSVMSVLFVFLMQRVQTWLPLNPNGFDNVPAPLAFNTSVSFVTNTNWQNYAGESTMSYLTQMAALAVQNFASAAVGLAVAVALIRGLVRRRSLTIGNFWVDLVRGTVRVLLPIALVVGIGYASQGVVQNFSANKTVTTVEGATQIVPGGPMASQESIKEAGTNGGGFLNANSAHPFENPNGLTNWFQMFTILMIPFALTFAFGRMAKDQKQGWVVFTAMFVLWIGVAALAIGAESAGNPKLDQVGVSQQVIGHLPRRQRRGEGGALRSRDQRPLRGDDDRDVERARSSPSTTASRRSAAWPL